MNLLTEELEAMVRAEASAMEQKGEMSPKVLEAVRERGLFKLLVPRELGGHMLPLPEALRVFEGASRFDGSFGWLVTIGAGGGYFAGAMEPGVCRELLSPREAVIAGSGYPAGEARRVKGGYRVSGRWKYISGADYATLFTVNCVIRDEGGKDDGRVLSFILMPEQVNVLKDWRAFGLKATGSHSIAVEDAFVPERMTFDIAEPYPVFKDPLFRYPFLPFALTSFAAVALGIADRFLEEARVLIEAGRRVWPSRRAEAGLEAATRMVDRLAGAKADFYRTVDDTWEIHRNRPLTGEEEEAINRRSREAAQTALQAAQTVFPHLGMAGLMENAPANRAWRDLHTVCRHALLSDWG
ncbi:acyl-CoA dehydrogenase family protein [Planifilum fimeticola]